MFCFIRVHTGVLDLISAVHGTMMQSFQAITHTINSYMVGHDILCLGVQWLHHVRSVIQVFLDSVFHSNSVQMNCLLFFLFLKFRDVSFGPISGFWAVLCSTFHKKKFPSSF